jgi:hypothetical protein
VSVADLDLAAATFDAPLIAQGFHRLPFEREHCRPAATMTEVAGRSGSGLGGSM